MKHERGFTLVEVMVTVVIVAILAAVAIPAYNNYVMRGKIAEATTNLSSLRVSMEQYFQDNRTYQNGGVVCGATMPTSPAVRYFTFTCNAPTTTTYTITATGGPSMNGFTYTVDQSNNKQTTAVPAGWGTAPINCWVTKPGGTC